MRRWLVLLLLLAAPAAQAVPPSPSLTAQVLGLLERELPGWERRGPDPLLLRALEEAEHTFPDTVTLRGPAEGQVWVRVKTAGGVAELPLTRPTRLAQLAPLLGDALAFLQQALASVNADWPLEADLALARGLLAGADPHAQLLTEETDGGAQVDAAERLGGIGTGLDDREGILTVTSLLPGSPAQQAGIRQGDRVLEIDDRSALGLTVHQAAQLVKGPVGSKVALTVLRAGEYTPRPFRLVRQDDEAPLVRSRILREAAGQRIGYLRIESFLPPTATDVRAQIFRMQPERPDFLGLILDLRGNTGGLLDQAIQVADLLLDNGRIVSVRGPRLGSETVEARSYRQVTQAPVVVLVNGRTASAAEIVAAALQANRRALVAGRPTYGKTTIQSVFPLSGGNALKLTVAHFQTGATDDGGHVIPHLLLSPVRIDPAAGGFQGLAGGWLSIGGARQRADGTVLPLFAVDYVERPTRRPEAGAGKLDAGSEAEDFGVALARLILFANHRRDFDSLLRSGLDVAAAEAERQQRREEADLRAVGIPWGPGNEPADAQARLGNVTLEQRGAASLAWHPVTGAARPGAELRIGVTAVNAGTQPLHRLVAVVQSEAPALDGLEFPIGTLAPGATGYCARAMRLPRDQPAGVEGLRLRLMVANGPELDARRLLLPIAAAPPAALRVAVRVDAARREATGGSARLRVEIQATGAAGEIGLAINRGRSGLLWQPRAWELFPEAAPEAALRFDMPLQTGRAPPPTENLGLRIVEFPERALSLSRQVPLGPGAGDTALESPTLRVADLPLDAVASPVTLNVEAQDDRSVAALQAWLNGRKVLDRFTAAGVALPQLHVAVPLALVPGRNVLTLEARDDDGFATRRAYVLWQEQEPVLAAQLMTTDGPQRAGAPRRPMAAAPAPQ